MVTTAGGLAMLVGLILLGQATARYRLSEMVASPGSGRRWSPARCSSCSAR